MAWDCGCDFSADDNNYKLVSVDSNVVTLRDEYIPVGYNLTTWKLNEKGEREVDENGNEVRITEFHQTGVINIKCKVKERVVVEEWVAADEATAKLETETQSSDTRRAETWRQGLAYVEVPNCIGTLVRVSSRRANDAGEYIITRTTTTTTKA